MLADIRAIDAALGHRLAERLRACGAAAAAHAHEIVIGDGERLAALAGPEDTTRLGLLAGGARVEDAGALAGFDALAPADVADAALPALLREAGRSAALRREAAFSARLAGLAAAPAPSHAFTALFTAPPSAALFALESVLLNAGWRTEAALSSFAAFDLVHAHHVDALVLNALESDEALTLANAIRKNAAMHALPCLVLTPPTRRATALDKGASAVISSLSEVETGAFWLTWQAGRRRRQAAERATIAAARRALGADTAGALTPEVFDQWLQGARAAHAAWRAPFTAGRLRIEFAPGAAPRSRRALARATRETAALAVRCLRASDAVCVVEDGVIGVGFPGADAAGAAVALKRVAAIADATAFSGDWGGAFLFDGRLAPAIEGAARDAAQRRSGA